MEKFNILCMRGRRLLLVVMMWQLLSPVTSLVLGQPPRCNSQCVYEYIPVCGTDGNTYPNLCFLFMASCRDTSLNLARSGPCVVPDPCNIVCNRRYEPVCGSDGVTYSNPCVLMYASCYFIGRGITRIHSGRCRNNSGGRRPSILTAPPPTDPATIPLVQCPFGCTREYLPVCGSDGLTYPNECNFNMVACRNPAITKVKDGPCDQQLFPPTLPRCPLGCNKVYQPICGSDGKTYTNLCIFTMATCKDSSISKIQDGPCGSILSNRPSGGNAFIPTTPTASNSEREFCRKDCPFSYVPLCGTDGVTYTNKCTFDVAVCNNATLKVKQNGNCI